MLTMLRSFSKRYVMNLLLDDWISWSRSVLKVSRFFSRKPAKKTSGNGCYSSFFIIRRTSKWVLHFTGACSLSGENSAALSLSNFPYEVTCCMLYTLDTRMRETDAIWWTNSRHTHITHNLVHPSFAMILVLRWLAHNWFILRRSP